jgi:hypothetical protein
MLRLLLLLLIIFFTQCRLTRLPAYDPELYQQIISAAGKTDKLYIDLRLAQPADRKFEQFSRRYAGVEKAIRIITLQYEARPFNTRFLPILANIDTLFHRYREEHRLHPTRPSNAELLIYQTYLRNAWKPLIVAEQALKNQ